MAPEDDIVRPDVASAGLHVSERIGYDVASTQLDLEESLEASRYASHPYAAHPKDVLLFFFSLSQASLQKSWISVVQSYNQYFRH